MPARPSSAPIWVGFIAIVSGCAAPNLSRTLGPGNVEVRASLGGPFFSTLGPTIPVPVAHVGARVGVSPRIDIDANLNALALSHAVLGLDVAANFQLYRNPRNVAVATSLRLHTFGDLDDVPSFRAYPELGLHVGSNLPRAAWLYPYGGLSITAQFRPPREKPPLFFTPYLGLEFRPRPRPSRRASGRARRHGIALHASWINPGLPSPSLLDYASGRGGLMVHLAYRLQWGGLER